MSSTASRAAIMPSSNTNNNDAVVSPNTTTQLTTKQKKALAVAALKELNLQRIASANSTILSYDEGCITTTAPDVKPFKKTTISNMNDTVFRIGDYVDVQANFSNGFNRR